MTKVCISCNIEKDESGFYVRKETGKLRNKCKKCDGKTMKRHYVGRSLEQIVLGEITYQDWVNKNKEYWNKNDPFLNPAPKKCCQCKKELPRANFYRYGRNADGLGPRCIKCMYASGARQREREPEKAMFRNTRSHARSKGIDFNIGPDDIKIPEFCPILGLKLCKGKGKPQDSSPSVDRIDPSKGYIKGNIRVISNRANRLKCDATAAEMEKVLEDLRRVRCEY
jgi:hypothetical protein